MRRWRQAAGAEQAHALRARLFQGHPGEVADHVGQQVGARVADLVEHLLADRERRDQAAGTFRLGHAETAIGLDFDDGEADVLVIRHRFPVGEVATGALGATLDQVAGEGGLGQLVVVAPGPTELVDQGGADHRTVHHPASDDDIGALFQRGHYARRAQVGVDRDAQGRQRGAAEHLADTGLGQLTELGLQVVAMQHGDLKGYAGLLAGGRQGGGAGCRIDPAGIADHADLLLCDARQQRRQHLDEVGGIAGVRALQPGAGHDRHGDFGQVIEYQVIQRGALHQLGGGGGGVAPEGGGAADAYGSCHWSGPQH
ncbi:hypothetical protein D3C85_904550 [compost metagenome]